jgi:spore maturation protein CgeB
MAAIFSSAKVVLNIHTWYGRFDHGVNPRLFEAAGCGAFQLVDWKREIPELFDCRTEVRCYRDIGELAPLLREVLADATARKAAAAAAQKRAYSEHSYVHRMRRLLEIVTSCRQPGAGLPAR